MPKITVVQVVYNNKKYINAVFSAIFNQTISDFNVVAVIAGNSDGGKEFLAEKFPQVEIIDPGFNIGFAAGHNLVFSAKGGSDFFQLVNPDLIMEPTYMENMVKVFSNPKVGAATGKLYNIPSEVFNLSSNEFAAQKSKFKILDTTGLIVAKSGRVQDRGQHQLDIGQFDGQVILQGVCAAGAMYRRAALESVKESTGFFDSDFHTTYEDVDLSWRMSNAGWQNIFAPQAIGYHARGAASTVGGYKNILSFIKYHKNLSPFIRQQSYKNHILNYLKNSRYYYPQFFIREFFMLGYILFFEIGTLRTVSQILKLIPKILKKRKLLRHGFCSN